KVDEPARFQTLDLDIWHESYTSIAQYFAKNQAYTTSQAKQQKNQSLVWLKKWIRPGLRFGQSYILQRGFLDGKEGFLLALLKAWYEWTLMNKISDLQRRDR